MNDNDLKYESNNDNNDVYRATVNLNTAFENIKGNINSATSVNIQDLDNDQPFDEGNNVQNFNNNINLEQGYNNNSNLYANNNQFFNDAQNSVGSNYSFSNIYQNEVQNNNVNVQSNLVDSNINNNEIVNSTNEITKEEKNVNYKPTMKQKKKPGSGFQVSKEAKTMIFIILFLLLVVFVIPYVYDFFKELDLVITS